MYTYSKNDDDVNNNNKYNKTFSNVLVVIFIAKTAFSVNM